MKQLFIKNRKICLIFFSVLVIGVTAWWVFHLVTFSDGGTLFKESNANVESAFFVNVRKIEDVWRPRVKKIGAEEAYQEYLQIYAEHDPVTQHLLGHAFGGLVYEEVGLSGLDICGNSFSFGCTTEFLGRALYEYGPEIVDELAAGCLRENRSAADCRIMHGVGHGIQAYFGYAEENLHEALAACKGLSVPDGYIRKCYDGAIMEYNFRTHLQGEQSAPPREFAERKGRYFPCDTLSETQKLVCYSWQPQWWLAVFGPRDLGGIQKFHSWCAELPEAERTHCSVGIARIIPAVVGWDIEKVGAVCDDMTATNDVLACRGESVRWFTLFTQASKEEVETLCAEFTSNDQAYCLSF